MFSFKFEPESEWFGTVKCVQSASRSLVLPYVTLPLCRPNPERSTIYCFIVYVTKKCKAWNSGAEFSTILHVIDVTYESGFKVA